MKLLCPRVRRSVPQSAMKAALAGAVQRAVVLRNALVRLVEEQACCNYDEPVRSRGKLSWRTQRCSLCLRGFKYIFDLKQTAN